MSGLRRALGLARSGARQGTGVARTIARAWYEGRRHRPRPPARGLVLEVGSGQAPHPRADVVVDKFPFDDFERPGEAGFSFAKPLVVADGERLPFATRSFDYVLALAVLEHAEDPERFAAELSRVAGRGFVLLPTRLAELTFGWPYHPWLIDIDDGVFVFEPKRGREAPFGAFFHRSFEQNPVLRLWWASERSRWYYEREWQERLAVRVVGGDHAAQHAEVDVEQTVSRLTALSEHGALRPLPASVIDLLRCPICGAVIGLERGEARCERDGHRFPLAGPVPVLLSEAAKRDEAGLAAAE